MIEQREQLFLPGLTEDHPVRGELALQAFECFDLACIRKQRDMALDSAVAFSNPVRNEIGFAGNARGLLSVPEDDCPQVFTEPPGCESDFAVNDGDVAPDSMALVTVDAAFPLLKVHRIAREVPVNQAVAPRVKIQPFLANRRAG